MTPERSLAQFIDENPECKPHVDATPNEYGIRLTPSGMFRYFEWAGRTGRIPTEEAVDECLSLLERFGEPIRHGRVFSWNQPKSASLLSI